MPRPAALLALLTACAPPAPPVPVAAGARAVETESVSEGPLAARLRTDDADLAIAYAAEHHGEIGPCGCPGERRGGLARFGGWLRAARAADPDTPVVVLHAGGFLDDAIGPDGGLRADVPLVNRWAARVLGVGGWNAIQASHADLPGLADLGPEAAGLPLVSAHVRPPAGAPPVARWIRAEAGPHVVGVTGITGPGPSLAPAPGWRVEAVEPALGAVLGEMRAAGVEVVVLLACDAVAEAREAIRAHPEVDVVLDAARHAGRGEAFREGGAIWVRVPYPSHAAGELRIWLEEGRIGRALDRGVDLDPEVPMDPAVEALTLEAEREIRAMEREIWGP